MTARKTVTSPVPVTLAIPEDPRSMALIDGTVKPEGIKLNCIHEFKSVRERHSGMVQGKYDAAEMSTSGYIQLRAHGGNQIALPVFFIRGFRHSNIFCRQDSPLKTLAELKGKTIGVTAFYATTIIWIRGMLHHDYGVTRDSVNWISAEGEAVEPDKGKVEFTLLNKKRDILWGMLDKGEIDAAIFAGNDGYYSFNPGGSLDKRRQEHGNFRAVQGDRKTIADYYKKTGIYSVIHTITLKLDLAKQHPQVPVSLLKALRQSRELAGKYQDKEGKRQMAEEIKFLGHDPYACKLGDGEKKALDALMDYMVEDGILKKKLPVESLFAEGTI